jgi:hypothetical protein
VNVLQTDYLNSGLAELFDWYFKESNCYLYLDMNQDENKTAFSFARSFLVEGDNQGKLERFTHNSN